MLSSRIDSKRWEFLQSAIGFNGRENSWQSEIFLTSQEPNACSDAPQTVTVESTVISSERCMYGSTDEANNNCGLQIQECFNEGNLLFAYHSGNS